MVDVRLASNTPLNRMNTKTLKYHRAQQNIDQSLIWLNFLTYCAFQYIVSPWRYIINETGNQAS